MNNFREKLLAAGVRNLKEFGYPTVDEQSIISDDIYSVLFERMLQDSKGRSRSMDIEINTLLKEIKDLHP